jgi:hypothetical protein
MARPRGIGLDLPPELVHEDVKIVRLVVVGTPPHLLEQLLGRRNSQESAKNPTVSSKNTTSPITGLLSATRGGAPHLI